MNKINKLGLMTITTNHLFVYYSLFGNKNTRMTSSLRQRKKNEGKNVKDGTGVVLPSPLHNKLITNNIFSLFLHSPPPQKKRINLDIQPLL